MFDKEHEIRICEEIVTPSHKNKEAHEEARKVAPWERKSVQGGFLRKYLAGLGPTCSLPS